VGTNLVDMVGSVGQVGGMLWVETNLVDMVGSVGQVGGIVGGNGYS
jgi:hypothetical protein